MDEPSLSAVLQVDEATHEFNVEILVASAQMELHGLLLVTPLLKRLAKQLDCEELASSLCERGQGTSHSTSRCLSSCRSRKESCRSND